MSKSLLLFICSKYTCNKILSSSLRKFSSVVLAKFGELFFSALKVAEVEVVLNEDEEVVVFITNWEF